MPSGLAAAIARTAASRDDATPTGAGKLVVRYGTGAGVLVSSSGERGSGSGSSRWRSVGRPSRHCRRSARGTESASGLSEQLGPVTAWYHASKTALEQGFTVATRPPGSASSFAIALHSSGGLMPRLTAPGAIVFTEPSGKGAFDYAGLKVFDARGKRLPASFSVAGQSLRINIADRGAVYPVTVDPTVTVDKELDGSGSEAFGSTVAVSSDGNTALVGGDGVAEIYTQSDGNGVWSVTALSESNAASDGFGSSVALAGDGDVAVVGAPTGTTNNGGNVFVYYNGGTAWPGGSISAATRILASPLTGSEKFGSSVALSSDGATLVVGAVGGNAAYVFGSGSGTEASWSTAAAAPAAELANPDASNQFGGAVAVSNGGASALVGAPGDSTAATGEGAAFLFAKGTGWSGGTTTPTADSSVVEPSDGASGDAFGGSVSIDSGGGAAVIGAKSHSSGNGEAYYLTITSGTATEQARFTAPSSGHSFAVHVAISPDGKNVIIGGTTTNAAYLYSGGSWSGVVSSPSSVLTEAGTSEFGTAVATATSTAAVEVVGDSAHGGGAGAAFLLLPDSGTVDQLAGVPRRLLRGRLLLDGDQRTAAREDPSATRSARDRSRGASA